jgi:initiation factor 1A
MLGNGRLEAYCFDGISRLCHIRGKLRKRVWIQQGDIVLIGLREFQDAKADVILKYDNEEARSLKAYGELPENGERAPHALPRRIPSPNAIPRPRRVRRSRAVDLVSHTSCPPSALPTDPRAVQINVDVGVDGDELEDDTFDFEEI